MDCRQRLHETFAFSPKAPPPLFESEFSEQVVAAWRAQGHLGEEAPEARLGLDRREAAPVQWRRMGTDKFIVAEEGDLEAFRAAYDPNDAGRLPDDWPEQEAAWHDRAFALSISPYNEGFLQIIGISNGATLTRALRLVCEKPELAHAQMAHYTGCLEALIERVLPDLDADYAMFYEPIASPHGIVISPEMYRRFAQPALERVVQCLEKHGVKHCFMWTSGRVAKLIPAWLDAGVDGFVFNHATQCDLAYATLREEYGAAIRLMGGVDWRVVAAGPAAIDPYLDTAVRPVLEQGGYVPHLDDTVREYMRFENIRYYREKLSKLIEQVFG